MRKEQVKIRNVITFKMQMNENEKDVSEYLPDLEPSIFDFHLITLDSYYFISERIPLEI